MHALPAATENVILKPSRRSQLIVFLALFAVAMTWACYTQHVWEDFYITYRASKNLATGHGLTFTAGERVHSFTSPLGALLPAVASLLTANSSDTAALWIFRLMSIAAFAAAGVGLWRLGRTMYLAVFPALLLVLLFATDAKTIDFTTNGMETPYLLLFFVWTLYALFFAPPRRTWHLGLSWAGLMWSRPDSFVYISILCFGVLVFGKFRPAWDGRRQLVKDFLVAGLITTALYGPWLIWATWYYGSPIPHTIIAKGYLMPVHNFKDVLRSFREFPFKIFHDGAWLGTAFMPPYGLSTGWPIILTKISLYAAIAVAVVWLLPLVRWEARVTSFAFTAGYFYLNYFAGYPAPWYVPTVTLFAFLTIGAVVGQIWQAAVKSSGPAQTWNWRMATVVSSVTLLPLATLALTVCASVEMRCSQRISESGNRRNIGLWLKAHAASEHDTVFLEPLGYIGFFSGLKMYDFPGLSSPEVMAARRKIKTLGNYTSYFPELITMLEPDWLVLRDSEVRDVNHFDRDLLTKYYSLQKVFDVRDKVEAIKFLPGRDYLRFDAHFEVYHRTDRPDENGRVLRTHIPILSVPVTIESLTVNKTWAGPAYSSGGNLVAHAPSLLAIRVPSGARRLIGRFGFFPGAYEKPEDSTEGAEFLVNLILPDGTKRPLFSQTLNPRERPEDRGEHSFGADISLTGDATVEFITQPRPGKGNGYGWTYWTDLKFAVPKPELAKALP